MSSSPTPRIAAITGANGTLGQAFTRGLASAGYLVYMLVRSVEKSQAIANEMMAEGMDVRVVACDLLDRPSSEKALEEVLADAGRVDVLLNCAGGNQAGATVMPDADTFDVSADALRQVIDLNLMGTMIPSFVFAKAMANQKTACIVNISSMAATQPMTRVVGYAAAKAAIDNFTKWFAIALAWPILNSTK